MTELQLPLMNEDIYRKIYYNLYYIKSKKRNTILKGALLAFFFKPLTCYRVISGHFFASNFFLKNVHTLSRGSAK